MLRDRRPEQVRRRTIQTRKLRPRAAAAAAGGAAAAGIAAAAGAAAYAAAAAAGAVRDTAANRAQNMSLKWDMSSENLSAS